MFSRLNNGRFDEDNSISNPGHQTVINRDGNSSSVAGSTTTTKTSVVGSTQARFLGEFNPLLNKPIERRTMNTNVVLLPELTKALEELSHSEEYHRNHKKKDSVKAYMDEVAKFSAATKFRK
jgi:hypothetical protein